MSHLIIADDGTLTLEDGATLDDIQLPEIPTLVQTVIDEQKAPEAEPPTQEQVDAIEEEARMLKAKEKAIKSRLDELATAMRRIPKEGSGITTASTLSTPKVIVDAVVEEKYPYDAIESRDVVKEGPRGGKKIVTELVFPNRHLYKITVDKTAVKKHLGPDELAEVQADGTTRVTFK